MEYIKKKNIWEILIYFIIFSIIGFLIETIYAIFTKGMLESRKSFLYGPFCAIYGIAAICMILILESQKENPFKIYFLGSLIGLEIEYIFSFLGELLFHARWWDYSNNFLNINGRICLYYAVIWGFLSLILIYLINPKIETIFGILKTKENTTKFIKIIVLFIIIFMVLDAIITSYALKNFINNICKEYNIEIKNFESKQIKENIFTKYFSNQKMIMIYPNISVITKDNKVLYLGSVLHQYKNYYYSFNN